LAISGSVRDIKTGKAIKGATVTISQTLNGKWSKSFTTNTDNRGVWKQEVLKAETSITASATNYVSKTQNFDEPVTEVPVFELKDVNGTIINIGLTYTNTSGETQNYYGDYANVSYSVENVSTGSDVVDFNVQYPQIVLMDQLAEGTEIRVTATSKNDKFMPVSATGTVDEFDRASVTLPIVQLGGIAASFKSTDNTGVVGILYDIKGNLVESYNYSSTTLAINELTDGKYTLVTMGISPFFNSISSLSVFPENGLREGVDFIKNTVTVKSGSIATISNNLVPYLDETKLYYTDANTAFTVNKSQVTVGQYLTLRGSINFKPSYASEIKNVSLVVDLPVNSSFVENSVMVGKGLSSYQKNGNRITIPVDNLSDQVRFCMMPTEGGKHTASAYVLFDMNGQNILQPIGDAVFTVKNLSISVPDVIARKQIPVRGAAIGKSEVEIYDNGQLIGKTTALANGTWSATCDLYKPYNLSNHVIFAKVRTTSGAEMYTETKTVLYDKNLIQANTVTMSFFNGWLKKTISVIFDFKEGKTNVSDYMFYTGTDITFVTDLTNNSPQVVNGVILNVFTDRNEIRKLRSKYDPKIDRWVASSRFESNNLPVNLSVSIDAYVEPEPDPEAVNEGRRDYQKVIKTIDDTSNEINNTLDKLESAINKANPSEDEIISLINEYQALYEDILVDYTPRGQKEDLQYNPATDEFIQRLENAQTDQERSDLINEVPTVNPVQYEEFLEAATPDYHWTYPSVTIDGVTTPTISIDFNGAPANPTPGYLYIPDGDWTIDETYGVGSVSTVRLINSNNDVITYDFGTQIGPCPDTTEGMSSFGQSMDDISSAFADQFNLAQGGTGILDYAGILYDVEREGMRISKALLETARNADGTINHDNLQRLLKIARDNHPRIAQIGKIKEGLRYGGAVLGAISTGVDAYKAYTTYRDWDAILDKIRELCDQETAETIIEKGKEYKKYIGGRRVWKTVATAGTTAVGFVSAGASSLTFGASLAITGVCFGVSWGMSAWEKKYERKDQQHISEIKGMVNNDPEHCKPFPEDPDNPDAPFDPLRPIHDPSGYVYEGVASNRLQGVTASCYYKETVEDMYGDLHENIVLWNAEEYAQENPLFTDENGMYQWDVPQGLWQVKFEKEGYQTTYSEWLPVPPPQLEVNIPMVQMRQPTVSDAKAYDLGVEIAFDKYMDPETLTTDNISVTKNGNKIEGSIVLLNEEVSYEGEETTFASKLRFEVPKGQELTTTDQVMLTVSKAVKSYAGVQMENDYSQEFDVLPIVRKILADSLVNIVYGGERKLTVAAAPADAAKGKTLTVKSMSEMIAKTSDETLTFDENGQAELTVTGELPGSTALTFMVDGSDVEGTVVLNVKDAANMITKAPDASRVSGTEVYSGTKIILTSETDGATIYYTLDGSCPCDNEARLTYNPDEPIVITEDNVVIKAMAQGVDLPESDVKEFAYTLKKSSLNYQMPKDWKWISHNLSDPVKPTDFQNVERIVSQTEEVINDPKAGLIGNLQTLLPTEAYKVKTSDAYEKLLQGYEFNASANAIPLETGWNWIGYPISQTMSIGEALAFFTPSEGDIIVGQDGSAEFVNGNWSGTLAKMTPSQGYLYKSGKKAEIEYNTSIVSNAASRLKNIQNFGNSPWAYNKYAYANIMPVTAQLFANNIKVSEDEYVVGAFAGTECRGIGSWIDGRLMMNVYGDGGEDIRFIAFNTSDEQFYNLKENVTFTADNIGNWRSPYYLSIGGQTTDIEQLNGEFSVTPTVVSDYIIVSAGARNINRVTLTNTGGLVVMTVDDLGSGGTITTSSVPEGVYIVTIQAEGQNYYKKIIKTNK
jgi:hypothetical protein